MSNPYIDYYQKQIGRGIPGYRGLRYQRGYGFLTSLISKAIVPLFRSVKSVDPGKIVKVAADILKSPGLTAGTPLADDIARIGATATGAFVNSLQGGKGRKYKLRRRRRKSTVSKKKTIRKVRKRLNRRKKLPKRRKSKTYFGRIKTCKKKSNKCRKKKTRKGRKRSKLNNKSKDFLGR